MIETTIYVFMSLLLAGFGIFMSFWRRNNVIQGIIGLILLYSASLLNFLSFSLAYKEDPSGELFSLVILMLLSLQITLIVVFRLLFLKTTALTEE